MSESDSSGPNAEFKEMQTSDAAAHSVENHEACWQSIGVYGNGECRELQKFVHCRNCPVYSRSALRLLDRPLPTDYRAEWAAHFAKEQKISPPIKASAVLFRIDAEWLALPTYAFQEVAERRRTHRSEEHTSELQSRLHLVCRLLLEKKKKKNLSTPLNKKQTQQPHR